MNARHCAAICNLMLLAAIINMAGCAHRPIYHPVALSAKNLSFDFTVAPAPEWSSLFIRKEGWFGGDGIFSVSKNGSEKENAADNNEMIIWFSDTMLGSIVNDSLQPGYTMINNSMAVLKNGEPNKSNLSFYWDTTQNGKPQSIFIPQTPATKPGDYYWLGDGFVNHQKNNDLYIFGYRIANIPGKAVFGFKETGNTLVIAANNGKYPLHIKKQLDIPFFKNRDVDSTGSFGAGVLVNTRQAGAVNPDDYVYVYGVRGKSKQVMVARVRTGDIESFEQWRFWDGKEWNKDVNNIQPVADRASNELSVTALPDGRYLMVFQGDGLGRYVGIRLANTPYGPFSDPITIYDTSEDLKGSTQLFSYNAKAHPALSKKGKLLISYNINAFDFDKEIKKFPHLYRPRFIELRYK